MQTENISSAESRFESNMGLGIVKLFTSTDHASPAPLHKVYIATDDQSEETVKQVCEALLQTNMVKFEYAGDVACVHMIVEQRLPFKVLKVEHE